MALPSEGGWPPRSSCASASRRSPSKASETLRLLDLRSDPVIAAFRDAPVDDEPWTDEDEAAAAAAGRAAGRTVSVEQAFAELDG
jgi:hypothetical protein